MNVQHKCKRWTLSSLLAIVFIVFAVPNVSSMAQEAKPAAQSAAVAEQLSQAPSHSEVATEQGTRSPLHSEVATEQVTNAAIHSQAEAEQASSANQDSLAQLGTQQDALAAEQSSTALEQEPLKRSKRAVETVLDVASLAHSTYEYNKNPSFSNAAFVAWDAAATFIPGVPGSYLAKMFKIKINILGKGSTGRTVASNLQEQLAMKEVLSNPLQNAKELKSIIMTDHRWLAREGWVKMSKHVNGIEIHFVYNKKTGAFDDFKFK